MIKYLSLISKYRESLMGISILWIMVFHLPLHIKIPIITDIFAFGYGGVDTFLFLSGFGLYFSLSRKNTLLSQYYKKRFCRILPEFWLFLIITYLISMDFSLSSFFNLIYRATTIGYWIPHTPYTLWYISCILFFYIIYPLYYKNLKKNGLKIGIIAISIGISIIIIYGLIMVELFDNKNNGGLLILTIARIPIFFIGSITGYFAKESTTIKLSKTIIVLTVILFSIAILSLKISIHYLPSYLWTCSLYFLPFIIITPISCVLIAQILDQVPHFISTFFSKVGTISLELYIVHEYLYSKLLHIYTQNISIIITILLSFISAFILYYINKLYLQRICNRLLM